MLSDKQLLDLAEEIYDVALDPSHWVEALTSISVTFSSNIAAVVTQENDSGLCTWARSLGLGEGDQISYATYYGTISPTFLQLHNGGFGDILTDEMHLNRRTYVNSEIYQDYYKPLSIERQTTVVMERTAKDQTYLCLRRPESNSYTDVEIQDICRVAAHVYRAIKLQRRTHFEEQLKVALNAALDHVKSGLVLLDTGGAMIKANLEAERIIAGHDGVYVRGSRLYIERNGCLVDVSTLVEVNGVVGALSPEPDDCVIAIRRPLMRPYIVFVYPLGRSNGDGNERGGTAVFITDTDRRHYLDAQTIQELFGLTPAEARLTAALAEGKSLQEYSDEASIASSTARSTLKSVFKKTQTSRQAELVRLVLSCSVSAK
ncbi:helix-turn-helix transcriptional regulator [Marinobacterium rhizophilum]|uniref:Helix-turn-helix transcriptional regulator n=1 Tax=Marinobacterium rhizophilum TaxID=420402 RepID=A0ABY5HM72_9GAMM|nr:helix-turn-helix transcriptional regulator [Marinobacterium rhizophilum]UTW12907.1 helix-turn-helix transcriptional regulator [Marinobacterium rhizophilum]